MKATKWSILAFLILSFNFSTSAQVQFSAGASYLKGLGDNQASLWGGGIGAKFFLGNRVALGANFHAYPKKNSSVTIGIPPNTSQYTSTDLVSNVAASFDFLLASKKSAIQPFIGTDLGLSFNNQTVTLTNNTEQTVTNKNNQTYFLLSPKAGINIGLGQSFGIFGQAQYNFNFGDGQKTRFENVPTAFEAGPVNKYLTFDAGIYVRLKGAGQ